MRATAYIPMKEIIPNRYQPRSEFHDDKIEDLAKSIAQHGLLQPIVVRKIANGYELVAGERRYRACLFLGYSEILALVDEVSDQQMAELALIENLQRENISAIDEAKAYQQLNVSYGLTQEQIASRLGKSQSAVANKLRLLQLEPAIQTAISNRLITERHGRALLSVKDQRRATIFKQIIEKGLNVQATEKLVEKHQQPSSNPATSKTKGIVVNHKIAVNTITQAVDMVRKVGFHVMMEESREADETVIIIKIKK